jgi:type I restriction enzyme, S subunit
MATTTKMSATPRLRFPEFRRASEWTATKLGQLAELLTERVGTSTCTPYTITSGVGLVSQQEKLGRTIAGNSIKNYIVLRRDDFAFNKSATKAYPEGYIARYTGSDRAAVPNSIFTCFRVNERSVDPVYLDYLFASNLHGRWLRKYIAVGARAHGSLNINDDDLLGVPVPLPSSAASMQEQRKIADCLTSLDDVIAAQARKVEALKAHKRGLMQQLFPREGDTVPRLRFPEFDGAAEWQLSALRSVATMKAGNFVPASDIAEMPDADSFPCYGGNGLRGYTKSFTHAGRYVLIGRQGALCGNVLLVDGQFHATEHAVVATSARHVDTDWLYYALDHLELNQYATGQAQPGLSVTALEQVAVLVPPEQNEQRRIAELLGSVDAGLAAESEKLAAMRSHKVGLMQQLFPSPCAD